MGAGPSIQTCSEMQLTSVHEQVPSAAWDGKVRLDLPLLIDANFVACAALISVGAYLGKATPTQVLHAIARAATSAAGLVQPGTPCPTMHVTCVPMRHRGPAAAGDLAGHA